MISRRNFLGIGAGALGSFLLNPNEAFSWGAFKGVAPTHQIIARTAYDLAMKEVSGRKVTKFPSREEILKCDWVSGNLYDGIHGSGPDVEGASPYSWHYYNPRTNKGRGPYAVSKHFQELVQGIRTNPNGPGAAHAASWTSHFIADMHVPYHVNGIPIGEAHDRFRSGNVWLSESESGPHYLYQLWNPPSGWGANNDFHKALAYYCKNYPHYVNGKINETDWFDPWYFNGFYRGNVITGSHAAWELDAHQIYYNPQRASQILADICSASFYDPFWKNAKLKFGQDFWVPASQQAKSFAANCAKRTAVNIKAGFDSPLIGTVWAMRAAATLFRAAMSTLTLKIRQENQGNGKIKCKGIVANNSGYATVKNVEVRLLIKQNGKWRGNVRKIGSISHGKKGWTSWDINTRKLKGYQAHMDVSGIYPDKAPDLGYVNKFFTINRVTENEEPKPDNVPAVDGCAVPQGAERHIMKNYEGYLKKIRGEKRSVGPYKSWYDSGRKQLKEVGCYYMGQPHGTIIGYNKDGSVNFKVLYNKGSYIKQLYP